VARLLEDFALDARNSMERMRSFACSGKSCAIAREAHRLRGSSGSIGAAGLAQGYGEIELRALSGATTNLPAQIEETSRLLDATVQAMHEFLRVRVSQTGPLDSAPGF
jgi:HPt (histidine-containing phosphotransfer) domain-containing protein